MTPRIYFRSTKTGKRFEIINLDKENAQITLRGEYATFTEKYDKAHFQRMGYVLEREQQEED